MNRRVGLLAILPLLLAGCAASREEMIAACPDATRTEIENQLGAPEAFSVTSTGEYQVEGVARVDGNGLWWGCTPQTGKSNLQIDVRDSDDSSQLIGEYVDF